MKSGLLKIVFILCLIAFTVFAFVSLFALANEKPIRGTDVLELMQYAPRNGKKTIYGYSARGRELKAWRFGNGDNVLVLTFALHGYEDAFARDGAALVLTANELMKDITKWKCDEWSIYVLPCCNPDGLLEGTTNEGFGRCTGGAYLTDGTLSLSVYADINRCFPVCWEPLEEERFYNGAAPLACPESVALAEFLKSVKGGGMNFCIDVHGWYQQTLTSGGNQSVLFKVFNTEFPDNTWADVNRGTGYLAAYAAVLDYESALFEFPGGIENMEEFENSGYADAFSDCVKMLVGG
ncbi:MAG: hypothetical protein IKM29_03365 [Clostridia bacterium]|nr:hypothetical protein [Clostridia bacterium]